MRPSQWKLARSINSQRPLLSTSKRILLVCVCVCVVQVCIGVFFDATTQGQKITKLYTYNRGFKAAIINMFIQKMTICNVRSFNLSDDPTGNYHLNLLHEALRRLSAHCLADRLTFTSSYCFFLCQKRSKNSLCTTCSAPNGR